MSKEVHAPEARINSMMTIEFALSHFKIFPPDIKIRMNACRLNLSRALNRCERLSGAGNCYKISPTMVQKRCPNGMTQIGCCSCVSKCPNNFYKENGPFCKRERIYELDPFETEDECIKHHKKCEKHNRKKGMTTVYTARCRPGFEDFHNLKGKIFCRVGCPENWKRKGLNCIKPGLVDLGTPYLWIKSDN